MNSPTNKQLGFQDLNAYFDKIYVLTLEHTTERQASIKKNLAGLNWEFFFGFDKKELVGRDLVQEGIYDDNTHRSTKRTSRSMNLGEVACAISHRMIFEDMVKQGYERVLIFEDDVLQIPEQLAHFAQYIKEVPDDWELLMLGYYGEKLPTFKYKLQQGVYTLFHRLKLFNWHTVSQNWIDQICMQEHSEHWWEIGKVLGAHAYAVSRQAAEKYINYQTPVILQADRIFNYYKADYSMKAYAPKAPFFTLSELNEISYIQKQKG